jgi:hypothetical protein
MASNFQIFYFKTNDSLHLKLTGDFDGGSAHELINTLIEHGKDFYGIFVDTSDLESIHPYGIEVFQKRLGVLKNQFHGITFLGKYGFSGASASYSSVNRICL